MKNLLHSFWEIFRPNSPIEVRVRYIYHFIFSTRLITNIKIYFYYIRIHFGKIT